MKEILLVTPDKILVRKLDRDEDEFNLTPKGKYTEHEATVEDIKRISPSLAKELEGTLNNLRKVE